MKRTNNTKRMLCIGLTVCMSLGTGMTAMAGTWKQGMAPNENRWWYDFDNGTYATDWQWIDGDQDGMAERYYFDESGWMLADTTTPDGSTVNADGAWVVNGEVQRKAAEEQPQNTQEQQSSQNQAAQAAGQYVSGSYGADGTWSDISFEQQYADFWGEGQGWVYGLMAAPESDDVMVRSAGALECWAAINERGAAWKAAFDRYGVRADLFSANWSGSGDTVTFTTPAGIESEAKYDVENAVKMMLRMRTDDMAYVTSCTTTVNGDGTITVTLSYEMGG